MLYPSMSGSKSPNDSRSETEAPVLIDSVSPSLPFGTSPIDESERPRSDVACRES